MTMTDHNKTLEIIAMMAEIDDPFLCFAVHGEDGGILKGEDGLGVWLSHGVPDCMLRAMNDRGTDWTVLDWLFGESLDVEGNPRSWSAFLPWAVSRLITGIESGLFVAMLFGAVPAGSSLPSGPSGYYLRPVEHALDALGYIPALQQSHRGRRTFEVENFPDAPFYLSPPNTCAEDDELPCPHCGLVADTGAAPNPCFGGRKLPGVYQANCGHGDMASAFVVFNDGTVITGADAVDWLAEHVGLAPYRESYISRSSS